MRHTQRAQQFLHNLRCTNVEKYTQQVLSSIFGVSQRPKETLVIPLLRMYTYVYGYEVRWALEQWERSASKSEELRRRAPRVRERERTAAVEQQREQQCVGKRETKTKKKVEEKKNFEPVELFSTSTFWAKCTQSWPKKNPKNARTDLYASHTGHWTRPARYMVTCAPFKPFFDTLRALRRGEKFRNKIRSVRGGSVSVDPHSKLLLVLCV